MPDRNSTDYINSTDYDTLKEKLTGLKQVLDDLTAKSEAHRKLRYADIDIEAEREAGRLLPDELIVPQHVIDTNIRREQSPYVQYVTQSSRAVICEDQDDPTVNLDQLDRDLTKKIRFDGWQLSVFACIDSFQANGYGVLEVIMDQNKPGELATESVSLGDFAFTSDTRDIQAVEMTARTYYFTKTRLFALCGDPLKPDPTQDFNREEVEKLVAKDPDNTSIESTDVHDKSLYKVYKIMFRVGGIVQVAWCHPEACSAWIRIPRPLYIGRRKLKPALPVPGVVTVPGQLQQPQPQQPESEEVYETQYPYIIFPYLISENDTISYLKGRIFLDQDLQEAVQSLVSSTCTQARRASGLYFCKDTSDPNDDLMMQKNIYFKSGCIVNAKLSSFQLPPPDSSMFSAIRMLVDGNANETSKVDFAVANRKDSRKTAKEVSVAEQQSQVLSTVQVVLFSIALTQTYRLMTSVIKSRVLAGLIKVNQVIAPLYQRDFTVKPAGDTDVIEKQQLIQQMTQSWPVIQNTPAGPMFLCDLIELMFPDRAAKYVQLIQQGQQQQQSAQAQQQQKVMETMGSMAKGIIHLAKSPQYFSETGRIHAYPQIEIAAEQLEQMEKQMNQGQKQ